MKKLMIALAAAVAFASVTEAGLTKWKFQTGSGNAIYDGYNNDGKGGYSEVGLDSATVYAIAVATDSPGVGCSQADLIGAWRAAVKAGSSFSIAGYATPVASGASYATTTDEGELFGTGHVIQFTNGDDDSGEFTSGDDYSFYLATLVKDGEDTYLYVSDAEEITAAGKTTPKTVSIDPSSSSMDNYGLGAWSAGGWYAAEGPDPVPEPFSGTLALLGMGAIALRRKMKKAKKA